MNDPKTAGKSGTTEKAAGGFNFASMQLMSLPTKTLLKAAEYAGVEVSLGEFDKMVSMTIVQNISEEDANKLLPFTFMLGGEGSATDFAKNPMMLMAMMGKGGDMSSMLPFLMGQGGDFAKNPMLMMAMMGKGGDMNSMLPLLMSQGGDLAKNPMLMMSLMGNKGGAMNPLVMMSLMGNKGAAAGSGNSRL